MRKINLNIQAAVTAIMMTLAVRAAGVTHYVDPTGIGDFTTIQAAIDAAANGDEIEVAPGTYNEAINFLGKEVRLYSSVGPDVTTIDANGIAGAYHVVQCVNAEDANTILEGFTITGGNANGKDPNGCGGGMHNYQSSPTVTNCTFIGNSAIDFGGGMYNDQSSPKVTNCRFNGNTASDGGGMENYPSSSPVVTGCTFIGNTADGVGGGMDNWDYCNPTVTNCTFIGNTADYGGGMNNDLSSPTVTNCTFNGNTAADGGGIENIFFSSPFVTNCTFIGNSVSGYGGGMDNWNESFPTVTNCTFTDNTASYGGGMYSTSNSIPNVANCIFWGDSPDEIDNSASTSVVTYCDVQGGYSGTGNINADPCFVDAHNPDPNLRNFRLSPDSLCIDAGDPNYVCGPDETDLDGKPRVMGGRIDMGAYEYSPYTYEGTCWDPNECPCQTNGDATCDGSINLGDLMALKAAWGQDTPWANPFCCADFNQDGKVNLGDLIFLKSGYGTSCPGSSTGNQKCYP